MAVTLTADLADIRRTLAEREEHLRIKPILHAWHLGALVGCAHIL